MIGKFPLPELTLPPPVSYSFLVIFYGIGAIPIPNGLDVRFQRVSGIGASFEDQSQEVQRGSMNQEQSVLRGTRSHPNLVLERGLTVGISPLAKELQAAVFDEQFTPHDVHVMLMNEMFIPIANWFFMCAYPVRWSFSDLDANQSQVMIETLELKYKQYRSIIL